VGGEKRLTGPDKRTAEPEGANAVLQRAKRSLKRFATGLEGVAVHPPCRGRP